MAEWWEEVEDIYDPELFDVFFDAALNQVPAKNVPYLESQRYNIYREIVEARWFIVGSSHVLSLINRYSLRRDRWRALYLFTRGKERLYPGDWIGFHIMLERMPRSYMYPSKSIDYCRGNSLYALDFKPARRKRLDGHLVDELGQFEEKFKEYMC